MYNLTTSEKREITETMKKITSELQDFWEKSGLKKLKVRIKFSKGTLDFNKNYFLHISENDIMITRTSLGKKGISLVKDGMYMESRKSKYFQYDMNFIKYYDKNRVRISKIASKKSSKKVGDFNAIKGINSFIDSEQEKERRLKEASIELTLPPSNNQHEVAITKENGRTVGVIDFGERMIKIITDGDITLVRREEEKQEPKVKQK